MTIIAYDGKCLAVDKAAVISDMRHKVTKIKKTKSGTILAWCGSNEYGLILCRWYQNGADPDKWPEFQRDENWVRLVVVENGKVFYYEQEPEPQFIEDRFFAWGSGRDFAMGALAMGATAEQAVEIASRYNIYCGLGCDVIQIKD